MLNYQRVLYSYGNDALFFAGQFKQNGPTIYTRWKALCIGERGTSICWQSTGMTKSYEQSTSTSQSGWCFTRLREICSASFLKFPPFGRDFWPDLRCYSFIYFAFVRHSPWWITTCLIVLLLHPSTGFHFSTKKTSPIPLPYHQAIFHRVPFWFSARFRPGESLARQGAVGRELNIVKSGTCAVLRKTGRGFRWIIPRLMKKPVMFVGL